MGLHGPAEILALQPSEILACGCTHLVQQDGEGVQEVIVAALKDVHNTDQAAAHVAPHLNL